MKDFVAVVMAGGRGQRFWPLSTEEFPKQFIDLERTGETLLQSCYNRAVRLTGSPERVLVATSAGYERLVEEQLPELPVDNIIVEPVGRDSAPAVAYTALKIEERFGDVVSAFFPSDHRIGDTEAFLRTIRYTAEVASVSQGLVTVGIAPTRPATGYGYIEMGDPEHGGFKVSRFVEKPELSKAEEYLRSGGFLWNSGIFVWRNRSVLEELAIHAPDIVGPLSGKTSPREVQEAFHLLPRISIDYALMEKTDKAFVVPGRFGWDDIGDWASLERLLEQDEHGNTVVGNHSGQDSFGNIVYTDGDDDSVVVTLGVKDLVIVKEGGTVMVVHKERVQDLKNLSVGKFGTQEGEESDMDKVVVALRESRGDIWSRPLELTKQEFEVWKDNVPEGSQYLSFGRIMRFVYTKVEGEFVSGDKFV